MTLTEKQNLIVSCEEDTAKFLVLFNSGADAVLYIVCDYEMPFK